MLHKMHLKNFSCKPGFIYFIYAANYSPLTSRYHCHAIRKNIYDGTLQHVECLEHIFISSCFIWKDNKTLDLRIPFWSVCLTRYFNMYTRLNEYGYSLKHSLRKFIFLKYMNIFILTVLFLTSLRRDKFMAFIRYTTSQEYVAKFWHWNRA